MFQAVRKTLCLEFSDNKQGRGLIVLSTQKRSRWLEIQADCKREVKKLRGQVTGGSSENSLAFEITEDGLNQFTVDKRVREFVNSYNSAVGYLKVKVGDKPDPWWLEGLTVEQRTIFLLHHSYKVTFDTIADFFNMKPSEAREKYIRIREKITQKIIESRERKEK